MKIGDTVRHKLSGMKMIVRRLSEEVATVESLEEEEWSARYQRMQRVRYVCAVFNLEVIEPASKQLRLY